MNPFIGSTTHTWTEEVTLWRKTKSTHRHSIFIIIVSNNNNNKKKQKKKNSIKKMDHGRGSDQKKKKCSVPSSSSSSLCEAAPKTRSRSTSLNSSINIEFFELKEILSCASFFRIVSLVWMDLRVWKSFLWKN